MNLSIFYFTLSFFILLPTANQVHLNIDSCPTSRRLLFFGRFNFSIGEKKPEVISSSSKLSSSPSKYARTKKKHDITVYVRPQTSSELGYKVHSYGYLLARKLFTKKERMKLKNLATNEKKKRTQKLMQKKNLTQDDTTTRDLVTINDSELDRCRTLLRIDHENTLTSQKDKKKSKKTKKEKNSKKIKREKKSIPSKVRNIIRQIKKKTTSKVKSTPAKDKQKSGKLKSEKRSEPKTVSDQKKKSSKKLSETSETFTQSSVNDVSMERQTSPPPSQSSTNTKSKREKSASTIEEPTESFNVNEVIDMDNNNNSVVDRAYHFVRNMFQLSDDLLDNNQTYEEDPILSSINEQQHHQSRRLLSIDDETISFINNDGNACGFNLDLDELNRQRSIPSASDLSLLSSILKRQLLSVKKVKRSISLKTRKMKGKKTNFDVKKPKVGWAYRYRISRYLADQKLKHTGHNKKAAGGGRFRLKQGTKKTSSSTNAKLSKRKLLELNTNDESNWNVDTISKQDITNSVSIKEQFIPKRQLLNTKETDSNIIEENDDEDNIDKNDERRRTKSYEEITDPVEIVRSYDRGLFKPRVGWQFRYRVSRYIDTLRANIQEDQERLKLGLEAIKRKTPQELSGRRKRVLDKSLVSETEEKAALVKEQKPSAGWRYRYRISRMLEAKQRGDYIDDEEEKRKARLEQRRKQLGLPMPVDDNDECIEWEYDILDPELRKIGEEGKRVGWSYRYRIRRKLDQLKQQQAETGIPFDWKTLGGKREEKMTTSIANETVESDRKEPQINRTVVGWKYRYRVSKMHEAQKREAIEALTKVTSEIPDIIPIHERLDPILAHLTPEERMVGWQYRYRIRRKLDTINNATRDTDAGKRSKKHQQRLESRLLSKSKEQKKAIKKVEESIEKFLNIDDIDETPFMEYFRRTSTYVLSGLIPTGRKSICLLPLPVTFSFCEDELTEQTLTTTELPKPILKKKSRTKKEKHPRQSLSSRSNKSQSTRDKIVDSVKSLSKTSIQTVEKPQRKQTDRKVRSSIRRKTSEQTKHFDEEEQQIQKIIGVESPKRRNKKRFQIIGKEVKIKHKHSTIPPSSATTRSILTTDQMPILRVSTPIMENSEKASSSKANFVSTTSAPFRSISEIAQEEAATLLSTLSEEIQEINESNESSPSSTKTAETSLHPNDNRISNEDNSESDLIDSSELRKNNENPDLSPMKKIQQFYEKAKENVHVVFDLKDDKDSS